MYHDAFPDDIGMTAETLDPHPATATPKITRGAAEARRHPPCQPASQLNVRVQQRISRSRTVFFSSLYIHTSIHTNNRIVLHFHTSIHPYIPSLTHSLHTSPSSTHTHMAPLPASPARATLGKLARRALVAGGPATLHQMQLGRRGLSVNHTQGVTLGVIAAYVVVIALLWNLPYVRWVLWPFKVSFVCVHTYIHISISRYVHVYMSTFIVFSFYIQMSGRTYMYACAMAMYIYIYVCVYVYA